MKRTEKEIHVKVMLYENGRARDFKPSKEFPVKQRDHKLTESKIKREIKFAERLIMAMFDCHGGTPYFNTCKSRDLVIGYKYLKCLEEFAKGELIDLEKAYWDLGIYELSKIYGCQ